MCVFICNTDNKYRKSEMDFHFNFWLQFLLDDGFQTAQNERLQLCAKTCETFVRVTTVVKRRIEFFLAVEIVGWNKIEKGEEFVQIILQWCPSDEKSIARFELADDFREFWFLIFDLMSFVIDKVAPIEPFKGLFFFDGHFISRAT